MTNNQSGAPLQPGATQPERGGGQVNQKISDDHLDMWIRKLHEGKNLYHEHQLQAVEELIANRALLTTLLERMARLVVQEIADNHEPERVETSTKEVYFRCRCGFRYRPDSSFREHLLELLLTESKLQQLREAVTK